MNKNDLKKLEFEFIYFETRTHPGVLRFENITISITQQSQGPTPSDRFLNKGASISERNRKHF
jgi:hypothetical protein